MSCPYQNLRTFGQNAIKPAKGECPAEDRTAVRHSVQMAAHDTSARFTPFRGLTNLTKPDSCTSIRGKRAVVPAPADAVSWGVATRTEARTALEFIATAFGLSDPELGHLLRVSGRSVRRWYADGVPLDRVANVIRL